MFPITPITQKIIVKIMRALRAIRSQIGERFPLWAIQSKAPQKAKVARASRAGAIKISQLGAKRPGYPCQKTMTCGGRIAKDNREKAKGKPHNIQLITCDLSFFTLASLWVLCLCRRILPIVLVYFWLVGKGTCVYQIFYRGRPVTIAGLGVG